MCGCVLHLRLCNRYVCAYISVNDFHASTNFCATLLFFYVCLCLFLCVDPFEITHRWCTTYFFPVIKVLLTFYEQAHIIICLDVNCTVFHNCACDNDFLLALLFLLLLAERNLEDHELVLDIISKWENEADCRLLMKSFTKKYEFFEKPAVSVFPEFSFNFLNI